MPGWRTVGTALVEGVFIVASVLLAFSAENWREEMAERRLERAYLEALAEDLRGDLGGFEKNLRDVDRMGSEARFLLETLNSDAPVADPGAFLIAVEAGARSLIRPDATQGVYDDMVGGGQLGLIRNAGLRRQISDYYTLFVRNQPVFELWRGRSWYGFGPLAIAAMPLDAQVWAASQLGDPDSPASAPPPDDPAATAMQVAAQLRADPRTEGLLKSVVRSTWGQASLLGHFQKTAEATLQAVEGELQSRWPE